MARRGVFQSNPTGRLETVFPDDFGSLQQHNAPWHTATIEQLQSRNNKCMLLTWPPNSPDLHRTEHLQVVLDKWKGCSPLRTPAECAGHHSTPLWSRGIQQSYGQRCSVRKRGTDTLLGKYVMMLCQIGVRHHLKGQHYVFSRHIQVTVLPSVFYKNAQYFYKKMLNNDLKEI